MTYVARTGNHLPFTFSGPQKRQDFDIKFDNHETKIAKHCYSSKQHFARPNSHARRMSQTPINDALAANLAYYMGKRGWTQKVLADKSGMGQTTISLYLRPERRKPGKSGKPGSAKLTEVEMMSAALEVEAWQLLRPMSPSERNAYEQIEAAFRALKPQPSVTASDNTKAFQ